MRRAISAIDVKYAIGITAIVGRRHLDYWLQYSRCQSRNRKGETLAGKTYRKLDTTFVLMPINDAVPGHDGANCLTGNFAIIA